jgi:hypothetical protein
VLVRAFATVRFVGLGLLPDLEYGEAFDRRDARPTGSGAVIISGRLP